MELLVKAVYLKQGFHINKLTPRTPTRRSSPISPARSKPRFSRKQTRADPYHRNDIRQSSRHLVVRDGAKVVADTRRPLVLYESGFAPRWYVPRQDIDEKALTAVEGQTFCPYKGLASYYDIGEHKRAAWSYVQAWPQGARGLRATVGKAQHCKPTT